jgi:hypothetical protein
MASNKTPNLNLDIWAPDDYFKRAEVNTNFTKIDAGIKDQSDKITVLSDNVKGYTNEKEIGITNNLAQQTYVYPNFIETDILKEAPTVKSIPNKGVDIIGHWYNDFGLKKTALSSSQALGAHLWYDWRWNHTTNANYDPSRHPLLGWYRGDDPKTLDWQCYWLAEAGVNVVSLVDHVDTSVWSSPSSKLYWQYVLFNQVKNFKSLKYITWLRYNGTVAECDTQHTDAIDNVLSKYSNFYSYNYNGKKYPVVFTWDLELMRGTYDSYNGNTNLRAHLKTLGSSLQAKGYDGICILARNFSLGAVWTQTHLEDLENSGVILLSAGYEEKYGTEASYSNSYVNYANKAAFPTEKYKVLNVMTSATSQTPHPSGWNLAGHTPELFKTVLQRAVNHVSSHKNPKMVTIYNVAEWAEGGPGLQPNKKDGFGYLDAVRAVTGNGKENVDFSKINFTKPVMIKSYQYPNTGVNNAYTTLSSVSPITGTSLIEVRQIKVTWDTGFQSSETVTIKIQFNLSDGTNTSIEKAATTASSQYLSDDDFATLYKHNTYVTSIHIMAKTNLASSAVPKTVVVMGTCR